MAAEPVGLSFALALGKPTKDKHLFLALTRARERSVTI